jgi:hypothetical protein
MHKVSGNHLGIVVNTQDPENRGRVQVFIPHISTTLYKNWNEKAEDISFRSFTDNVFSGDVKERLLSVLPWAEAAVPCWGGGTGAPVNESTGTAVPMPTDQAFSSNADPETIKKGIFKASQGVPWSGGFISSIANSSGSNFPSNLAHAGYVNAISNGNVAGWQKLNPSSVQPKIGDIVVGTRVGGSHGDVVTGIAPDGTLTVVGGNISNTVKQYTKKISSNDYAIIRSTDENTASNMAKNAQNEYSVWSSNGWNENSPEAIGRLSQYYEMQSVSSNNSPTDNVIGKTDQREWVKTGLENKDGSMDSTPIDVTSKSSNLSQLNPNTVKGLYALGMAETGFNSREALSNANNAAQDITDPTTGKRIAVRNKYVAEEYARNGGDLASAQAKYGDYGYFQVNQTDVAAATNRYGIATLNSGSAAEQMVKVSEYIKRDNPNAYAALERGDYDSAFRFLGDGKWPSLNGKYNTNNLQKAYAALNTDYNQIIKNVENAEVTTPPDPSSDGNNIFRTTNQGLMATGTSNVGRVGGPMGFFSTPAVGSKVWVFFQAENPQNPVYFANAYEPSNTIAVS